MTTLGWWEIRRRKAEPGIRKARSGGPGIPRCRTAGPAMKRHSRLLCLWLVLCAAVWVGYSRAGEDNRAARHLRESGQILSLERIVQRAKAAHPGKLLDIELDRDDGRYVYEVELVDERGVVWELKYDAVTGALLEHERED